MAEKMFEKASRLNLSFPLTGKGSLSVTDLWDLPLTARNGAPSLQLLASALKKQLKDADETENFFGAATTASKANDLIQLRFDLVLYIGTVLAEEAKAAAQAKEKAEKKQEILALLADAEKTEMKGKSKEELLAMLAEL